MKAYHFIVPEGANAQWSILVKAHALPHNKLGYIGFGYHIIFMRWLTVLESSTVCFDGSREQVPSGAQDANSISRNGL